MVETASNGVDGLDKLCHDKDIDLALIDFNLPEMNAIEMIQKAYQEKIDDVEMIIWSEPDEYDKYDVVAAISFEVRDWFEKSRLDQSQFLKRVKQVAEGLLPEQMSRMLPLIPGREFKW
jgi:DNA-binding NarL/FixJ family response regulator